MPTIKTRNCNCCGKVYTGTGKQFCSVACRVKVTGAEKVRIMQEKNTRFHPEDFDTAKLDRMYNQQKMTCAEIGEQLGGIAQNTIRKILVAKGFAIRKHGELPSRKRGCKRSKEFIQKHIDWFKTHTHHNLGKHNPTPIRQRDFYNKICPNCKISFRVINWRKKFCSRKCWYENGYTSTSRTKMSASQKRLLDTPEKKVEMVMRIIKKCSLRPNIQETALLNLINQMGLPYKFTGDLKFWIENQNPDFVNCNGQKKIIELFGEYWHDERIRQAHEFTRG